MNARYMDPIADHSAYSDEQERKAATHEWTLLIEDLIEMPIVVDGVTFDTQVDASFTRQGERGPIEINEIDFSSDLYITLPGHLDLVKLDRSHYEKNHLIKFNRLLNHIELLALTKARLSNDWEQKES